MTHREYNRWKKHVVYVLFFAISLSAIATHFVYAHDAASNIQIGNFSIDSNASSLNGVINMEEFENNTRFRMDSGGISLLDDGDIIMNYSIDILSSASSIDDTLALSIKKTDMLSDILRLYNNQDDDSLSCAMEIEDDVSLPDDFSCGETSFSIVSDRTYNETIEYAFSIDPVKPDAIKIEYWVEDVDGNVVRNPFLTENTETKRYTPSTDERFDLYTIKANLSIDDCNETYQDSADVTYINDDYEEESDKYSLEIEHIYQESDISFGSELSFRVHMSNVNSPRDATISLVSDDGNVISSKDFGFFRGSDAVETRSLDTPEECEKDTPVHLVVEAYGMEDNETVLLTCEYKEEDEKDDSEKAELSPFMEEEGAQEAYDDSRSSFLSEYGLITGNTVSSVGDDEQSKSFLSSSARAYEQVPRIVATALMVLTAAVVFFSNSS